MDQSDETECPADERVAQEILKLLDSTTTTSGDTLDSLARSLVERDVVASDEQVQAVLDEMVEAGQLERAQDGSDVVHYEALVAPALSEETARVVDERRQSGDWVPL